MTDFQLPKSSEINPAVHLQSCGIPPGNKLKLFKCKQEMIAHRRCKSSEYAALITNNI